MTGASRRKIEKVLFEEFYDGTEYIGSSFNSGTLLNIVGRLVPNVIWKDIYQVIRSWQKSYKSLYDGIYNEHQLLLEAGVTDDRDKCCHKYQNGLDILAQEKKVPLYFDPDIQEYRVAKDLNIYEEIIGDKILKYHNLRNDNLIELAKHGGKLLSGAESRAIIYDLFKETKSLENKKDTSKETED